MHIRHTLDTHQAHVRHTRSDTRRDEEVVKALLLGDDRVQGILALERCVPLLEVLCSAHIRNTMGTY